MKGKSMNETKAWYLSRTVWASIVTIVIACCSLSAAPVPDIDEGAFVEALLQLATAIAGAVALFGRLFAQKRIE
jgi:hypothetical protein